MLSGMTLDWSGVDFADHREWQSQGLYRSLLRSLYEVGSAYSVYANIECGPRKDRTRTSERKARNESLRHASSWFRPGWQVGSVVELGGLWLVNKKSRERQRSKEARTWAERGI